MLDRLTAAILAVCPIFGVSGVQGNITISFDPLATGPQISAANTTLAAFDWSQGTHDIWLEQQKLAVIGIVNKKQLQVARTTNLNPAWSDVVGMSFDLLPNKHYTFRFEGAYFAVATTTGLQLAFTGPASPVRFVSKYMIAQAPTSYMPATSSTYDVGVNGTTSPLSSAPLWFEASGQISTGANGGNLQLRFRSEVNGSLVTIAAGSYATLEAINP